VVHAVWVERITADVRTMQQVAGFGLVMGGKPEWPDLDGQLDAFEEWLTSEPERLDPQDLELRQALGLRGRGG